MGRRSAASILAILLAVLLVLAAGSAASADPVPAPRGEPYVGPVLDWTKDGAQGYTDRLGTSPSFFAQSVRYPLDADDRKYLRQFVDQAAENG